jgi:hypothetical protein
MPQSSAKRSPLVDQLLNRQPQHEPEVEEAIAVYKEARARSRQTTMLDLRLADGTVESFAYSYLTRVTFIPGDTVYLRFGKDEIRVVGRNLKQLCETITEQRMKFIQEGMDGEEALKAADEPHVDRITITELEEE